MWFVQEAAGQHCQALSLDWDTLAKRHMFWAVIRSRMEISRLPEAGETITVETWPMPATRVAYPRSVVAYDKQGNELFRSVSLWVLMDTDTRAMLLPGKNGIPVPGSLRGNELPAPGSIVPKPLTQTSSRTVSFTDLDKNNHMNNTRYLDWIDDLLPSAFHRQHPVREITLCYLSEAREGEPLCVHWELKEDMCLQVDTHRQILPTGEKPERVFSASIRYA